MKIKEEYMTEQENVVLESAIGDMGAEPKLGKLKHKAAYGQKGIHLEGFELHGKCLLVLYD